MKQILSVLFLYMCLKYENNYCVAGQYESEWGWINNPQGASQTDNIHRHHYHDEQQEEHLHHVQEESPYNDDVHHVVWENIEPLANIFKEEESVQDQEKYNKKNLFKVGEFFAPEKPNEPRHEVIVDDHYEEHHGPTEIVSDFTEYIHDNPSRSPFKTAKVLNSYSVQKSKVVVDPADKNDGGEVEEIVVEAVEAHVPEEEKVETEIKPIEDEPSDESTKKDEEEAEGSGHLQPKDEPSETFEGLVPEDTSTIQNDEKADEEIAALLS